MGLLVATVSLLVHFGAAVTVVYLVYSGIETGEHTGGLLAALSLAGGLLFLDIVFGLFVLGAAVTPTVTAGIGYLLGTITAVSVLRPEATPAHHIPDSHG